MPVLSSYSARCWVEQGRLEVHSVLRARMGMDMSTPVGPSSYRRNTNSYARPNDPFKAVKAQQVHAPPRGTCTSNCFMPASPSRVLEHLYINALSIIHTTYFAAWPRLGHSLQFTPSQTAFSMTTAASCQLYTDRERITSMSSFWQS